MEASDRAAFLHRDFEGLAAAGAGAIGDRGERAAERRNRSAIVRDKPWKQARRARRKPQAKSAPGRERYDRLPRASPQRARQAEVRDRDVDESRMPPRDFGRRESEPLPIGTSTDTSTPQLGSRFAIVARSKPRLIRETIRRNVPS